MALWPGHPEAMKMSCRQKAIFTLPFKGAALSAEGHNALALQELLQA